MGGGGCDLARVPPGGRRAVGGASGHSVGEAAGWRRGCFDDGGSLRGGRGRRQAGGTGALATVEGAARDVCGYHVRAEVDGDNFLALKFAPVV